MTADDIADGRRLLAAVGPLTTTENSLPHCGNCDAQMIGAEADLAVWLRNHAAALLDALEAARCDAERVEWYFGPSEKGAWINEYLRGMRAGWGVDQWRAAIDSAMSREESTDQLGNDRSGR